jgi:hypothetical protein
MLKILMQNVDMQNTTCHKRQFTVELNDCELSSIFVAIYAVAIPDNGQQDDASMLIIKPLS